jgi:hypothetical protein
LRDLAHRPDRLGRIIDHDPLAKRGVVDLGKQVAGRRRNRRGRGDAGDLGFERRRWS